MMTSSVTSRRIFNNFRAEMDRAQMGRFGPTRCGPVYTHSLLISLLSTFARTYTQELISGRFPLSIGQTSPVLRFELL